MEDKYEESSLEPRSRAVARVLLILADAPEAAQSASHSNGVYGSGAPHDAEGAVDALPEIQLGEAAAFGGAAEAHEGFAPAASDTAGAPGAPAPSAPAPGPTITHPLYLLLLPSGHSVVWTTRDEWELDISTARSDKFDVIIVEADAATRRGGDRNDGARAVCHNLRRSQLTRDASILVVVPPVRKGDKSRRLVESLLECGADDFFPSNASSLEVESRVRAMAQLARTRDALESLRDQIRTQLQTDDLTKLLNRRFFFQAAHREVGRARRYKSDLSCLMIEIDHYKKLCSLFGWDCGDMMLRELAQVLRDYTRDSDIVARFADEKFVVVLPETEINGATMLREKIQAAVQDLDLSWRGHPLPISISVGEADRANSLSLQEEIQAPLVNEFEDPEHLEGTPLSAREELAELLKAADAALFVARRGVRLPSVYAEIASRPASAHERDEHSTLPSLSED